MNLVSVLEARDSVNAAIDDLSDAITEHILRLTELKHGTAKQVVATAKMIAEFERIEAHVKASVGQLNKSLEKYAR